MCLEATYPAQPAREGLGGGGWAAFPGREGAGGGGAYSCAGKVGNVSEKLQTFRSKERARIGFVGKE